jgi:hypothetical protein
LGNTALAWSNDAVWTREEGWVEPELDHIGTCPRRVGLPALGASLPAWMRPGSAVGRVGVAGVVLAPLVIERLDDETSLKMSRHPNVSGDLLPPSS